MECTRKVTNEIYWVGCNDRRLALFENLFPIPRGVCYNSYLIMDEKTALMDTVDFAVSRQFLENIDYVLGSRELDYLVVQHMEPDHCANIDALVRKYPGIQIVGNTKTVQMIRQFYDFDIDGRTLIVKEGDELSLGKHTLRFIMAPMVHWPEVMVTYETLEKILFTADGFGAFGALNGNIFNNEIDFDSEWLDDARRYYANIVGKYGTQVQNLLKKAAGLDISMLCPLHGPVWRTNLEFILDKYNKWSIYEPEDGKAIMIAYASIYGNTENVVNALASRLADRGHKHIAMYDVSSTHVSKLISEAFRCSHIVIACPTYNGGIYPVMEAFLNDMKALAVQNRTIGLIDNGTWAPAAGKLILKKLEEMKNITVLEKTISIKSAMKHEQEAELDAFADQF